MTTAPTPGQIAYEAYWRSYRGGAHVPWERLTQREQPAWEAAAQAVLAMQEPPACPECGSGPQEWPYRYRIGNRVYWDADRTHIYTIMRREVDCTHERPLRFLYRLSRNGVPLDWVEESMLYPVPDKV